MKINDHKYLKDLEESRLENLIFPSCDAFGRNERIESLTDKLKRFGINV